MRRTARSGVRYSRAGSLGPLYSRPSPRLTGETWLDGGVRELLPIRGKTALVTGGSRGIGFMIAGQLLDAGAARVYICARKAEACDAAALELSSRGECVSIPADVGQPGDVEHLAAGIEEREQRL